MTASQANWVPAGFAISREYLRVTQSYETEAVEQLFFNDTTKTFFNDIFTITTMTKVIYDKATHHVAFKQD